MSHPGLKDTLAVIAMACRLPGGADSPAAFWRLLEAGTDAVAPVPADRWNHSNFYSADPTHLGTTVASQGGFLSSVFDFDAGFFGISPREAEVMDPQHRLLLELAFETFESAGMPLETLAGSATGVFIGVSTYDVYHDAGSFGVETHVATGVSPAMAANRISYTFDLRGPSLTIDTACSASLTALDMARRSLATGQCEQALVGAVNVMQDPALFTAFTRLGMLSPSNRCHAFDSAADGFVRGEGAVMFLVKPLAGVGAEDPLQAVVLTTELNQDGLTSGITVPNERAQEALLVSAYRQTGLAERLFAIETHGTGTPVGDPIEARSIASALRVCGRPEGAPLWLGSVKTNIGHLEGAAGAAGLLKAILSLQHGQFPANLHFHSPSLDLQALGLAVPTRAVPIPEGSLVGVSSFGFGGSSGHAVVGPPPPRQPHPGGSTSTSGRGVLALSARSPEALAARVAQLIPLLEQATPLGDLLYSAAVRSTHHSYRVAFAGDRPEMLTAARQWLEDPVPATRAGVCSPVFVFSGQGPQWWGMGRELLREQPVFRQVMERCDALLREKGARSLLEILACSESTSPLAETEFAQPAIFALQAGLLELWRSWGVEPSAVVGHSVGEIAAAYAAGVLSLEQAVAVVYHRATTMQHASAKGRMLSVSASLDLVTPWLERWSGKLEVGAVNGPAEVSVSGQAAAVEELQEWLGSRGVPFRPVPVQYAFHSSLVDSVRRPLRQALAGLEPGPARIPLVSTVTGAPLQGPEMDAEYWWRNVRQTVRFAPAVDHLLAQGHDLFLEVSPHPVLSGSLLDCAHGRGSTVHVVASLRRHQDQNEGVLRALGRLWCAGVKVDWKVLHGAGKLTPLPPYPWQRRTFRSADRDRRRGLFAEKPFPALGVREDHALPTWRVRTQGSPVSEARLLEMALQAAVSVWGPSSEGWRLRQLTLNAWEAVEQLQTCLDPATGHVLISAMRQGGWTELLRGFVEKAPEALACAAGPPTANIPLSPQTVEHAARLWGFACQAQVTACSRWGRGLRLELEWPGGDDFLLNPERLGTVLLSALALREPSLLEAPRGIRLAEIDELQLLSRPEGRAVAFCELESEGADGWSTRFRIYDGADASRLCLEISLADWKLGPPTGGTPPVDRFLLEPVWVELPPDRPAPERAGARLIGPAAALLEGVLPDATERTVFVADASPPLDQIDVILEHLRQAESEPGNSRWVLLTRGAQPADDGDQVALAQAPLLGFWRALQIEYPRLRPLMIDLAAQPEPSDLLLLAGLLDSGESELALRGGKAMARRFQPLSLARLRQAPARPKSSSRPSQRGSEAATLLVSGGLSGLGAAVARSLAVHGASHLLLLSRRGRKTPGAAELVEELESLGATVRVEAADVAELSSLPLQGMPALKGIFHAANHMEDSIIAALDRGKLERVYRAKAEGAWRLHELSLDQPLEHFVLFSSISAVFGAPGQANYGAANAYLDALAHNRRALGLPALVINWGPVGDTGYLERHPEVLKSLEEQGYRPLSSAQLLEMLGCFMGLQRSGLVAADADWSRLDRGARLSLLRQAGTSPQRGETERTGSVLDFLEDRAVRILRLPPGPELRTRPLRELGLDSVMAVEFRNAVESRFRVPLPVRSILSGPTLEQLAEQVRQMMSSTDGDSALLLPHMSDDEVRRLLAQLEGSQESAASRPPSGG